MTDEAVLALIDRLKWTFAKTYAQTSPHEYAVVRAGDPLREEFLAFMRHIFDKGYVELYYGHPFVVYKIGGRKYWSMAESREKISDDNYLINRTPPGLEDKVYE